MCVWHGAGGTFALYSLLCRHANFSHLQSREDMDEELSAYRVDSITQGKQAQTMKSFVGKHSYIRTVLLLVVLLGTCMLIGDGVLTPTISGENFFFVSVRNTKFSFLVFVLNVSTCFCFRVQCCLQCQAYKLQLTSSVSVSSSNTILASFFSLIKSLDKEFLLQIKYFQ